MLTLEDLMMRGAYVGTNATTGPTLTASELLRQVHRVMRMLNLADAGRIAPNGPLQVRENPMALQTVPVKCHKRRRHQSDSYHRRVQKKWTKRYGTKQVPSAYMIDNSVIGGYGKTLVAHPAIVARLKTPNVEVKAAGRRPVAP